MTHSLIYLIHQFFFFLNIFSTFAVVSFNLKKKRKKNSVKKTTVKPLLHFKLKRNDNKDEKIKKNVKKR